MIGANRATMAAHLAWLVGPVRDSHPDMRIELACGRADGGPNIGRTFRLDEIDNAVGFASWANARGLNCYVGATLKRHDTPAKGRTKAEHAELATALAVDIDSDFRAVAQKLLAVAAPALIVRTGATPRPRGQIWLRVEPTGDLALWNEINARAVMFSGGDGNALGAYRVMRLAGTVSYPSPAKAARGYITEPTALLAFPNAPTHDLNDLLARFPLVGNIVPFPKDRRARRDRPNGKGSIATAIVKSCHEPLPLNKINVALIESMSRALPAIFADSYDSWIKVGMALYSLDWDEIGLALWERFSRRSAEKAGATDFAAKWATFAGYGGAPLTIGWLRREAEAYGWRAPRQWDRETPDARHGAKQGAV
jgi:hypothetical protein